MRKLFGTDGVRGIANKDLDSLLAYKLGRAGAYVLSKGKKEGERIKVVVGTDTRISKDMLEMALCSGIMSMGADVISLGVVPTPAVAYLTKKYNADCGVVISASHNPAEYNGIKFFNQDGYKLSDEIEIEIESLLENMETLRHPEGADLGRFKSLDTASRDYVDYLKSCVGELDLTGLKVVLDCANGASFKIAPTIYQELGAQVICTNCNPDGTNINVKCGSTHPEDLKKQVKKHSADIGLAYDGDADRLIAIDELGNEIHGDFILAICANYLKKKNKLKKDTLVVTVMSNIGLHVAAKENGFKLTQTQVGDRYVLEEMMSNGYNLGGEQSGHLIFLDYNTTGDGVLSSLMLCRVIVEEKSKLSKLASIMKEYPQVLVNAKVKNEHKNTYMKDLEISQKIQGIEEMMQGQGRVLIRPSGTEPLVRVMLEGKNQDHLQGLAVDLANLIESKLS